MTISAEKNSSDKIESPAAKAFSDILDHQRDRSIAAPDCVVLMVLSEEESGLAVGRSPTTGRRG
jgi:hypothetical protein